MGTLSMGKMPSVRTLQIVAAAFMLLKLTMLFAIEPIDDEAYYWMWGQHFSLSYFDHPPLHAWALGAVSVLFGWSRFALRVLTLLTLAGAAGIFWAWAGRLVPEKRVQIFWQTLVVYLATPTFTIFSTISFHDHMLIVMSMASINFFALYFADVRTRQARLSHLYLGAIFLGLAVLSKYNGVFVGLGVGIYVLFSKDRWTHLRNPHLYLAALVAIAMQFPVIYWNFTEGFASFEFHLVSRHMGNGALHPSLNLFLSLVVRTALALSPFLTFAIVRTLWISWPSGRVATGHAIAVAVFAASSLVFFGMSFFILVADYWNIVAYLGILPFAAFALGGGKMFWAHTIYGFLRAAAMAFVFAVMPLSFLNGGDVLGLQMFGWKDLGIEANRLRDQYEPDFLAAATYREASKLGFELKTSDFATIDLRADQFDYWFDDVAHLGQSALIISPGRAAPAHVVAQFETFEPVSVMEIRRFGELLTSYSFDMGYGYLGDPMTALPAQDPASGAIQ